jgi:signal transduction histidine kinase
MPAEQRNGAPNLAQRRHRRPAGRAAGLAARVARAARRAGGRPDWPLVSALALGLAAVVEVLARVEPATSDAATALLLNLLATVPLALRRSHLPVAAATVTAALFLTIAGGAAWTVAAVVAQLVVLYLVAARYERRVLLLFALPFLLIAIGSSGQGAALSGLLVLVVAVAALALGDARRLRGQVVAERDAARRAAADAQRDQAAVQERARIARELHDVVAHHVSMIAVQAETARLTSPGLSDDGRERFEAIGATARDALTEMRRLLAVLREDAGGLAERAPQPGLDRLDELLGSARAAGTRLRLILHGEVVPLSPGVDLAAYRILQEALTNARRHAPGAAVDVELRYDTDTLRLRIRDTGPGPAAPGPAGHGLLGMRERAAMVGGTLRTGAADGGGFVVEADLPLGSSGKAVASRAAGGLRSGAVTRGESGSHQPEGPGP